MDTTTLIGVFGASLILIAFILNQLGALDHDDKLYDGINLIGSGLLIWYAILLSSWPFLALNTVWFVVSLKDLVLEKPKRRYKRRG